MDRPAGIDVEGITAWFRRHVPGCTPPLLFTPFTGGKSNLTFAVRDGRGRRWVLRRPPLNSVVPSAHDMGREHRILSALVDTQIPVPRVLGLGHQSGAPFYVAEFVEGVVLRDEGGALDLSPAQRLAASESLIDVLSKLHLVSPEDVGLSGLSRKDGYVERQLSRWYTQWTSRRPGEGSAIDRVHAALVNKAPAQTRTSIVHGDFKLANLILGPEGQVRAVLDWELCTLGEPLADLGLLLAYWPDPWQPAVLPTESAPTYLEGFLTRQGLVQRYQEESDQDTSGLSYYIALAYWKLAIIIDGVFARHSAGAYGTPSDEFDVSDFPARVKRLAEASEATLG
jgi:aminoglycoside phosphotransferase (APT) family kinase protein